MPKRGPEGDADSKEHVVYGRRVGTEMVRFFNISVVHIQSDRN